MSSKYKTPTIGVIYVDGKDHVLGRLSSHVAKLALEGYEIHIINSEKVVITGKKDTVLEYWRHKILERGDWYKGPFYPKRPDLILRRVIRGMLPKNWRGKIALKRVKCYIGVPKELENKEFVVFKDALITEKLKNSKRKIWYIYLEDLAKYFGLIINK